MIESATRRQEPTRGEIQPTRYNLQGYDIQITYSTTSFTGEPQFTYSSPTESRTFIGSDIILEDTGLGRLVTVMLRNNQADEGFESVTLLLPAVQLSNEMQKVSIQTFAILNRRFIFVAPGANQLQNYNPIYLTGTAEFVVF